MLFKLLFMVSLLLMTIDLYSVSGVEFDGAKIAKRRILINPPLSSFLNSHLLNMERLAQFYAENGYEVYVIGMDFLQTRRNAYKGVHLLTCPLLTPDDPAERERLIERSPNYIEEKLRPIRLGSVIFSRAPFECESILAADNGRFVSTLKSYNFDLVLFEFDCGLILADYLGIPKIIVDNAGIAPMYRSFVNVHLASFPLMMFPFSNEMSLVERTVNVGLYSMVNTILPLTLHRRWTRLYNALLKTDFWDLSESYYNSSMMFVNTRREFEYPVALMPNVLPIGCSYLKQPDSSILGADLLDFISNRKVIYVSFGTVHRFTESQYQVMMKAFSQLTSYRVVWSTRHQFASSIVPEHVRLVSWIDQPTILSSKETQLFIGHGGLNSALETAYYGTPYLIIPLLGDQFFNCRRVDVHQMGRCLHQEDMTETSLVKLVEEMLNNPLYKRNAMKLSRGMQFHDVKKDMLYWTETIIEHKGWPFLDSPSKRLPWYSYFLLDVILVISVIFILLLSLLIMCCRCMKRCCCCCCSKTKKKVE